MVLTLVGQASKEQNNMTQRGTCHIRVACACAFHFRFRCAFYALTPCFRSTFKFLLGFQYISLIFSFKLKLYNIIKSSKKIFSLFMQFFICLILNLILNFAISLDVAKFELMERQAYFDQVTKRQMCTLHKEKPSKAQTIG